MRWGRIAGKDGRVTSSIRDALMTCPDATFYPGAGCADLIGLPDSMPRDHIEMLQVSNGAEIYGGYFRLFGAGVDSACSMMAWNDPECWKFAWGGRCARYWCFGGTAWGDQYAYHLDELNNGSQTVYFLDGLSMDAVIVAPSFRQFLASEFSRNATDPYDIMTVKARQKLGDLPSSEGLIYSPSPLISGQEEIDAVVKMDARSAMILNGDIAEQIDRLPAGTVIRNVEAYSDRQRRARIRLITGSLQ